MPWSAQAHNEPNTWVEFRTKEFQSELLAHDEPYVIEFHEEIIEEIRDDWQPTYAIPAYIVMCESGGDYLAENDVSTASGTYQITDPTWAGYGGYSHASDAPPAVQDAKAAELWAGGAGSSHWVSCL